MIIPPKQKTYFTNIYIPVSFKVFSVCNKLYLQGFLGYSTILNLYTDLSNFQTHATAIAKTKNSLETTQNNISTVQKQPTTIYFSKDKEQSRNSLETNLNIIATTLNTIETIWKCPSNYCTYNNLLQQRPRASQQQHRNALATTLNTNKHQEHPSKGSETTCYNVAITQTIIATAQIRPSTTRNIITTQNAMETT